MNIQMLGETAQEKMARIMARNAPMIDKINKVNTVVLDVVSTAPANATAEDIQAVIQERLHPTKSKPPYLTYAALAVGAYLMFK